MNLPTTEFHLLIGIFQFVTQFAHLMQSYSLRSKLVKTDRLVRHCSYRDEDEEIKSKSNVACKHDKMWVRIASCKKEARIILGVHASYPCSSSSKLSVSELSISPDWREDERELGRWRRFTGWRLGRRVRWSEWDWLSRWLRRSESSRTCQLPACLVTRNVSVSPFENFLDCFFIVLGTSTRFQQLQLQIKRHVRGSVFVTKALYSLLQSLLPQVYKKRNVFSEHSFGG